MQKVLEICQNCILGVKRNHWCNCFPVIVFYSLPFGHWAKKFFRILFEGVRPRCQNCVLCVQKEVLTKIFSKPCFFSIILGLCLIFNWLSDKILSAGLSKLSFTCPGDQFKEWLILWKKCYCFLCSPYLSKKLRQCCRNCIHRVQMKFPKIFSKSVTVSIFSDFEQNFWGFTEHFLTGLSKLLFMCSEDLHGTKGFPDKNLCFFPSLLDFEQNVFVFSLKKSDSIVKIAFHMSRETFWGFFSRKFALDLFRRFWSKTVRTLIGKPLTGALKRHCVCPD